jgi:hypothetical protein
MKLEDLRRSITQMDDAELLDAIKDVRRKRRMPFAEPPKKLSAPKKQVASINNSINKLNPDAAAGLLAILEKLRK